MFATINVLKSAFSKEVEQVKVKSSCQIKDLKIKGVDIDKCIITVNGKHEDKEYLIKKDDVITLRQFPREDSPIARAWNNMWSKVAEGWDYFWDKSGLGDFGNELWNFCCFMNDPKGYIKSQTEKALKEAMENRKTQGSTEDIPTLQGSKNRVATDQNIPIAIGEAFYTPQYIGKPYTLIDPYDDSDGEKQYFNGLFSLGYGDIKLDEVKLGVHTISNTPIDGTCGVDGLGTVPIYQGHYKDYNIALNLQQKTSEQNSLYPQKVVQETIGAELIHYPNTIPLVCLPYSAKYPEKVQIEFQIQGLVHYKKEDGSKENNEIHFGIAYSTNGGQTYQPFEGLIKGTSSLEVDYLTTDQLPSGYSGYATDTWVKGIKTKAMRFVAEKTFSWNEIKNMTNGVVELLIWRIDEDKSSEDSNYVHKGVLTKVTTWCVDYEKSLKDNVLVRQTPLADKFTSQVARLGFRMQTDKSLESTTLDELHVIMESRARYCTITTVNGEKHYNWSAMNDTRATNNPIALALLMLQHPSRAEYVVSDDQIDMEMFGRAYEICEQTDQYLDFYDKKKYVANGVLTSTTKTFDLVNSLISCCHGRLTIRNGKYSLWFDQKKTDYVALLNNQNVLDRSNTKSYQKEIDGYLVSFTNKLLDYQRDAIICVDNYAKAHKTPDQYVLENLDLPYLTDAKRIYRECMYRLACLRNRRELWTVKMSVDSALINCGDVVAIQDDTLSVGIGEGAEIVSFTTNGQNKITKFRTDVPFEITDANKEYGFTIQAVNGENNLRLITLKVVNEGVGEYDEFTLETPVDNIITAGDICSFGIYNKIVEYGICFSKKPNNDGTTTFTFAPYNEAVYNDETLTGEIPEYISNVTPAKDQGLKVTDDVPMATLDDLNKALNQIVTSEGVEESYPDDVTSLTALAEEDGIILKPVFFETNIYNSLDKFVYELKKGNGEWQTVNVSDGKYYFNRNIDGYPEKNVNGGNLDDWQFRVKARNMYGKYSKHWVISFVDTSDYLTWIPSQPVIATPRISHRIVTLNFGQSKQCYGGVKYLVSIQRYDEFADHYDVWAKPDINGDPYASEYAYKDISATEKFVKNGITYYYHSSNTSFTQTLPLEKQLASVALEVHRGGGLLEKLKAIRRAGFFEEEIEIITDNEGITQSIDTDYYYRVWCYNTETERVSDEYGQVHVTAKATSAYDIVDSAIITNKLADGAVTVDKLHANCVTAEKLYSRNLTSLGAFIGNIYGARIDDNQYIRATEWESGVEYYVYDSETESYQKAVIQPTEEDFDEGTWYKVNPNYGMPSENANSYWKGLDSDNPEFRIGNNINAEMFELKNSYYQTEAEYMHYVPKNITYPFNYVDPRTGQKVSDTVTLPQGIYFKIANFIVTAIESVIKGVFLIKNKLTQNNFVEANPETTAQSGVPAETMNIKGDVNIGNKSDKTAGNLNVAGNETVAGNANINGTLTVGTSQNKKNTTLNGNEEVYGYVATHNGELKVKNSQDATTFRVTPSGDITARSLSAEKTIKSGLGFKCSQFIQATSVGDLINFINSLELDSGNNYYVAGGTISASEKGQGQMEILHFTFSALRITTNSIYFFGFGVLGNYNIFDFELKNGVLYLSYGKGFDKFFNVDIDTLSANRVRYTVTIIL